MTYNTLLLFLGVVTSVANAAMNNTIDTSTYANIEQVHSTHLELNFEVDFAREVFEGSVTHWMNISDAAVTSVFFDAAGLTVSKTQFMLMAENQTWMDATFAMTTPNANLGDAIEVTIPTIEGVTLKVGDTIMIKMTYVTNE